MKPTKAPPVVFLVGFMGAGKTSVGRAMARKLGWRFVDLDDLVSELDPRSIARIFEDSGEAAFRRLEGAALRRFLPTLPKAGPTVMALGGGAFVQEPIARKVRSTRAPVVFLDAPVDELRRRCAAAGDSRPLFADPNRFRQLYEERRMRYMAVKVRVDTGSKDVEQVAAEVISRLRLEPVASPRQEAR